MTDPARPYTIEFYDDPSTGRVPVHEWITQEPSRHQRRALGMAMSEILERMRHRYYLGGQLAVLRKRRGITQIELAAQSGVEQADISKIERGVSNPTEDTLARLGKVLGARLAFVDDRERVAI